MHETNKDVGKGVVATEKHPAESLVHTAMTLLPLSSNAIVAMSIPLSCPSVTFPKTASTCAAAPGAARQHINTTTILIIKTIAFFYHRLHKKINKQIVTEFRIYTS